VVDAAERNPKHRPRRLSGDRAQPDGHAHLHQIDFMGRREAPFMRADRISRRRTISAPDWTSRT
jgi:hypothetical protein